MRESIQPIYPEPEGAVVVADREEPEVAKSDTLAP